MRRNRVVQAAACGGAGSPELASERSGDVTSPPQNQRFGFIVVDMKLANRCPLFLFATALLLFLIPVELEAQQSSPQPTLSSEELAVYAAVLDSSSKLGQSSRSLIADMTSTFACGDTICNGLSMDGCNGLRSADESPSGRMAIVKRDLPNVENSTLTTFEAANQACASIPRQIPVAFQYYLYSDPDIPKSWKYSYLVYFSRVGFNSTHTQALVNVGLMSSTNSSDSGGDYFILNKVSGKWVLGDSSAVWRLAR